MPTKYYKRLLSSPDYNLGGVTVIKVRGTDLSCSLFIYSYELSSYFFLIVKTFFVRLILK